jgi:hypothetical protein
MGASPSAGNALASVTETMVDVLLPLFLGPAGGDPQLAAAMVRDRIEGYGPRSVPDLLRIGRIIGLRMSAVDHLRLSMESDGDVRQCWDLAASLSREADQILRSRDEAPLAR